MRYKAVYKHEQEIYEYTEENRKIDMGNINLINSNAKKPVIIAKLKTTV